MPASVCPASNHLHQLTPGSVLILCTDGLVERRDRADDEGTGQLVEALRRHDRLPIERLLDEIVVEIPGGAPDDDIAVLAVSVDPTRRQDQSER